MQQNSALYSVLPIFYKKTQSLETHVIHQERQNKNHERNARINSGGSGKKNQRGK